MLTVSPETALRNRLGALAPIARRASGSFAPKASDFERLKPWNFETWNLLADAELADHGFVALGIVFLEVVEQTAPLAHQHEKSAARAVVFLVRLEVLRQLSDAFAEQGDLNFRAPGIARMRAVLVNEGFLLLS